MRKIKSVKLAKEFNNGMHIATIGNKVERRADGFTMQITNNNEWRFSEDTIRKNETGLFAIEYEPEGFEFVPFGTRGFSGVFDFDKLVKSELNRLADWCDGQSEEGTNVYMITYNNNVGLFNTGNYTRAMIGHGLKFNSSVSAALFITELNKPENSEYKNYFINLLKQTRL